MAAAVTFCRLLGRSGKAVLSLPQGARCLAVRTSPTGEKITHTGQVYDDKDYRKIRFVGRQKEVNENFAIDLIAEQPVSEVGSRVIACDGGGGGSWPPKSVHKPGQGNKDGDMRLLWTAVPTAPSLAPAMHHSPGAVRTAQRKYTIEPLAGAE